MGIHGMYLDFYLLNHFILKNVFHRKALYCKGMTTWTNLWNFNLLFKIFHELAPACSSNILSLWPSESEPPNSKTPLPLGVSAIALSLRPNGNAGPVMEKRRKKIQIVISNIKILYLFCYVLLCFLSCVGLFKKVVHFMTHGLQMSLRYITLEVES